MTTNAPIKKIHNIPITQPRKPEVIHTLPPGLEPMPVIPVIPMPIKEPIKIRVLV